LGDGIVQGMESYFAKKENKKYDYSIKRVGIAWLMGNVFMMPLFHYNFTYALPWLVKRYRLHFNLECLSIPQLHLELLSVLY
jgi:protein Mpv17